MTASARVAPLHAVVIAGGAGERFWPASRTRRPKPFLEVLGGQSLLDETLARARRFARGDRVWVVCGKEHAAAMRRESGLPANRILVEPRRRNTAMAVAWAALRIQAEDPRAVMAVLPADHHVPDPRAFAAAIRKAARAASDAGVLVTIGIRPTRPDTGFGYIQGGAAADRAHPGLRKVKRFVEKPDAATARRYLKNGGYRWNAGVFVWGARTLLEEIEVCEPALHKALEPLRKSPKKRAGAAVEATYRRAPSLPVDVAVMERSRRVWTLPVDFAWSDVGTWASLQEELARIASRRRAKGSTADDGNQIIDGDVMSEDASGNLVWGRDRLVALVGVEDLAVVDTGDVILVTKLDRSPDVRKLVARLKQAGRVEFT